VLESSYFSPYILFDQTLSYPLTLNIIILVSYFAVTNEKKHSDSNKAVIFLNRIIPTNSVPDLMKRR
jgi:hypothetical protein